MRLDGISKFFGSFRAVDGLSLGVLPGEIFALLGPSGCGKSTTLRQIAGLDQPDQGRIAVGDRVLFDSADGTFVPAQKRNMGMVFQSYAIWPHLSIFETVAYPLRLRRTPAAEADAAVRTILQHVGLAGLEQRRPTTLSGGQQQRVALARALVYKPDVLLLDEPFSNLDVKLREQMRVELKMLQRQVGVTVILVTHDQAEALSLSDRIAVMNAGRVEQVGDPLDLYERPATPFVRDFIGQTTKIPVEVTGIEGENVTLSVPGTPVRLASTQSRLDGVAPGARGVACIRPESIVLGDDIRAAGGNMIEATLEALLFVGDRYECFLNFGGEKLIAYAPRGARLREGQPVRLQLPKEALTLWPS